MVYWWNDLNVTCCCTLTYNIHHLWNSVPPLRNVAVNGPFATKKFLCLWKEAQQLETCFLLGNLVVWTSRSETDLPTALLNGEESGHDTPVYAQCEVTWIQQNVKWKLSSFTKKVPSSVMIPALECFAKHAFTSCLIWTMSKPPLNTCLLLLLKHSNWCYILHAQLSCCFQEELEEHLLVSRDNVQFNSSRSL